MSYYSKSSFSAPDASAEQACLKFTTVLQYSKLTHPSREQAESCGAVRHAGGITMDQVFRYSVRCDHLTASGGEHGKGANPYLARRHIGDARSSWASDRSSCVIMRPGVKSRHSKTPGCAAYGPVVPSPILNVFCDALEIVSWCYYGGAPGHFLCLLTGQEMHP